MSQIAITEKLLHEYKLLGAIGMRCDLRGYDKSQVLQLRKSYDAGKKHYLPENDLALCVLLTELNIGVRAAN